MKNIIRFLCLLMVLLLSISLTACASAEDKAFDEANALLEAGDYDGAIAAFSAIGRYQEISEKIEQAQQLRDEKNAGFLFGTWFNLINGESYTFHPDGTGTLVYETDMISFTYSYTDGIIKFTSPEVYFIDVKEIDGVMHLTNGDGNFDLVSEDDYAVLGPQEVEITLENWEEYFELRQANNVYVNNFGEVEHNYPCHGIFLKEEFYDRISPDYVDFKIDFELTYDEACFKVLDFDPDTESWEFIGDYTFEPTDPPRWWDDFKVDQTEAASIEDRRHWEDGNELDPYYQKVAAPIYNTYGGSSCMNNAVYCKFADNLRISRVQGTLRLYP